MCLESWWKLGSSLSPFVSLRPKGRFLLWPTTAAACSGGNSSCWEEYFPVQTLSLTAAATRCTSSTRTSRSGTSLSSRAVDPLLAQGRMVWFTKAHLFPDVAFHAYTSVCPSRHSACVMQERKIFVFGGWDTPICFNDMYMLDLGKGHTLPVTSCLINTHSVWRYKIITEVRFEQHIIC